MSSKYTESWLRERLKANPSLSCPDLETVNPRETSTAQPAPRYEPLGASQVQKENPGRFLVRVKSYRVRLADEDGLIGKYHIDCLRYAGYLPNDSPEICRIESPTQEKCKAGEERVEIELYRL